MALEYDLKLHTTNEPAHILSSIVEQPGLAWTEDGRLAGPGAVIGAFPERVPGQQLIEETFGFKPTVSVWFRLAKHEQQGIGVRVMLEITNLILHREVGDAVLLFNGEQVVLQRLNHQLQLNDRFGFWHSDRRTLIDMPYEVVNISSPLL